MRRLILALTLFASPAYAIDDRAVDAFHMASLAIAHGDVCGFDTSFFVERQFDKALLLGAPLSDFEDGFGEMVRRHTTWLAEQPDQAERCAKFRSNMEDYKALIKPS